jgi:hypothetical protein
LDADFTGYLSQEHNPDGTHANITADSVSVVSATGSMTTIGTFVDVPYAPSIYTGSGAMTWTVTLASQLTLCYELVGQKITVIFAIQNTDVGGTPSLGLEIALPLGLLPSRESLNACWAIDHGSGFTAARVSVVPSGNLSPVLLIARADNASWAATSGSADTSVFGQITYPVRLQ